jgi:hypothetical protein
MLKKKRMKIIFQTELIEINGKQCMAHFSKGE